MRAVKVIRDPEAFQLLADETRRRMINLLRAKELTVSQIAQELGKTPQNIYHHIRKLVDGGLVEITREERIENFVENYYSATAEIFEVTHGMGDTDLDEAEAKEVLRSLSKAGLTPSYDDKTISKAIRLLKQTRSIGLGPELSQKLEKIDDAGVAIKLHEADYAQILLLNDREFDEYQRLQRELRELLTKRPREGAAR